MAFPVVQATNESAVTTAGTSHAVNLPSGITSGDLLIILFGHPVAVTVNALTGWTELVDDGVANGVAVLVRTADGTEGATVTLTTSANTKSSHISYRVSGAKSVSVQLPTISTVATGTSNAPNPGNCNPGTADDYLWLTFFVMAGEELDDDTWCNNAATNYTSLLQKTTGTGGAVGTNCEVASSQRNLNAAAEDAAWPAGSTDQSLAWRAHTIAVWPAPPAQTITCTGLGTAEAFGSAQVNLKISATSIASGEAHGQTNLMPIRPTSVASAEAFGAARVNMEIDPAGGIASAQVLGAAKVNLVLPSVGNIASAGAFGTAKVNLTINTSGIASVGAFGVAKINLSISLSSVGSSEVIGSHTISTIGANQFIGPASSIDAFNRADSNSLGSPWVESEANIANIGIAGNQLAIVSATAGVAYWDQDVFGQNYFSEVVVKQHIDGHAGPAIRVQVGSIYTSYSGYFVAVEATGLRLYKGAGVSLLAIGNLTQIGSFVGTINVGDAIRLEGYGTTITVRQNGVSRISVTDAALSGGRPGVTTVEDSVSGANGRYDNWGAGPGSVPSSEAFGLASAHRVLGAIPIGTGEAFGSHALIQEQFVAPGAIASGGAVGSHTAYQGGAQSILAQGIASAQTLGSPRVIRWPSYHSGHPQRAEASMRQRNEAVRAG